VKHRRSRVLTAPKPAAPDNGAVTSPIADPVQDDSVRDDSVRDNSVRHYSVQEDSVRDDSVQDVAAELDELPIIEFVSPMPGFPTERRFVLVSVEGTDMLFVLASVEQPGLRFLVMPPPPFFPDYAPEIDDEALDALGGPTAEELLVLLVVTTGDTPSEASVNLMAPIILVQNSRRAIQLVLSGSGLPVQAPLLAG
jgi:flagellar assembly factor FliW